MHDTVEMNQIDHSRWQSFVNGHTVTTLDGCKLMRYRSVAPADRAD